MRLGEYLRRSARLLSDQIEGNCEWAISPGIGLAGECIGRERRASVCPMRSLQGFGSRAHDGGLFIVTWAGGLRCCAQRCGECAQCEGPIKRAAIVCELIVSSLGQP